MCFAVQQVDRDVPRNCDRVDPVIVRRIQLLADPMSERCGFSAIRVVTCAVMQTPSLLREVGGPRET